MEKYEALFPRAEKLTANEVPPEFDEGGLNFEKESQTAEKLNEQIEDALVVLQYPEEVKDRFADLNFEDLCTRAQQILHQQGERIVSPEKILESAKNIMLSRLDRAEEGITYHDKKRQLIRKQANLARLSLGALKGISEIHTVNDLNYPFALEYNSFAENGFTEKEIEMLYKRGIQEPLLKDSQSNYPYARYFKQAPEFFLKILLNQDEGDDKALCILKEAPPEKTYSKDLLKCFLERVYHSTLLRESLHRFPYDKCCVQNLCMESAWEGDFLAALQTYKDSPSLQRQFFLDGSPYIKDGRHMLINILKEDPGFLSADDKIAINKDLEEAEKILDSINWNQDTLNKETEQKANNFINQGKGYLIEHILKKVYRTSPELVFHKLLEDGQLRLIRDLGISEEHQKILNTHVLMNFELKGNKRMHDLCLQTDITPDNLLAGTRVYTLAKEIEDFLPNYALLMHYFRKYLLQEDNEDTVNQRKESLGQWRRLVELLPHNKSCSVEDQYLYTIALKGVYPPRNYNTYKHLNEYKDRSSDIEEYKFEREGYEMRLSGVVGYRIKEGLERDSEVLENYQSRIQKVQELAQSEEGLGSFIKENFPESKAETLEGKVLEYVQQHRNDAQSLDLLLAYQLQGHYDQFVGGSRDRTEAHEQIEGKEYVMLSELSERYGDLMKETLKELSGKISGTEDERLFGKDSAKDIERGEKLGEKILEDLSRIPRERLSTETIQKKVATSIVKAFQGFPAVKEAARAFAQEFTVDNFNAFSGVFSGRIRDFISEGSSQVDIRSVEELRQKTYADIKQELDKYEEIKEVDDERKGEVKMSKERLIKGYFSKNRENAHARMVGDICLAADPTMLENRNYFEFVMFDEERKKCVGTVMLLRMEEPDGKKFLLYCPNPSVDLVSQVSAEKLYKLITSQVISFAQENNFDGVVFNKQHGQATNRSGLFQAALEKSVLRREGNELLVNLQNEHVLSGGYKYQAGLNAVWLKESVKK